MLFQSLALLLLAAPADQVDFEREILPTLSASCFECHGAAKKKPKGGLRLDGADWIRAGGKNGAVLEAGKSAKSELYLRVALPHDDFDIMPPEGEPLAAEQIERIRTWIDEGASFGAWAGAPRIVEAPEATPSVREPERIRIWRELGEGLEPLTDAKIAKLDQGLRAVARIEPVFEGSPLLRVSFPSREAEVTDALLEKLKPLRSHLAVVDLARAKVTDRGMAHLAGTKSLTHLILKSTAVGDAGVRSLNAMAELRSLNLCDTQVTDASIPGLAAVENLKGLYLWKSEVTKTGVVQLRKLRPDLHVRFEPGISSGMR